MLMDIVFNDTHIQLLASGALFIKESSSLILSDLHLGKGTQLQDNGVPLIDQIDQSTIDKLLLDLNTLKPKQCIICGDLIHVKTKNLAQQLNWFEKKIQTIKTTFILTTGNHDHEDSYKHLPSFKIVENYKINNMYCSHFKLDQKVSISGHVHPGIKIRKGRITKYFKAFAISENNITLPSYGDNAGSYSKLDPKKIYYYINSKKIIKFMHTVKN